MTASEEPVEHTFTIRDASRPQAAGVSDRFARLRAELAEAVASAELAMVRKEVEKWQAVAGERERALDRADLAIRAFATALASPDRRPPEPTSVPNEVSEASRALAAASRELAAASRAVTEARDTPAARQIEMPRLTAEHVVAPPPPVDLRHEEFAEVIPDREGTVDDDLTPIPDYVREEAARYAQTLEAMQEYKLDLARPRHWWQFWR